MTCSPKSAAAPSDGRSRQLQRTWTASDGKVRIAEKTLSAAVSIYHAGPARKRTSGLPSSAARRTADAAMRADITAYVRMRNLIRPEPVKEDFIGPDVLVMHPFRQYNGTRMNALQMQYKKSNTGRFFLFPVITQPGHVRPPFSAVLILSVHCMHAYVMRSPFPIYCPFTALILLPYCFSTPILIKKTIQTDS